MRDPEMFKYDVRVRDRMLRAGRITAEEINERLQVLPDLESECEEVQLLQPALELAGGAAAPIRQAFPSGANESAAESQADDEVDA